MTSEEQSDDTPEITAFDVFTAAFHDAQDDVWHDYETPAGYVRAIGENLLSVDVSHAAAIAIVIAWQAREALAVAGALNATALRVLIEIPLSEIVLG